MHLLEYLLVIFLLSTRINSFNYYVKNLDFFQNQDASFGRSILLAPTNPTTFIVGAPTYNSNFYGQNGTGSFFICSYEYKCQEHSLNSYLNVNLPEGTLLGATIVGGEKEDDPIYVCAPRWHYLNKKYEMYAEVGVCFRSKNSKSGQIIFDGEFKPFFGGEAVKDAEYYTIHGQVGLAAHYKDGSIWLGAPGLFQWRGTFLGGDLYNFPDKKRPSDGLIKTFEQHSYLGYSITSSILENEYIIFVGAPRANMLKGTVAVFTWEKNSNIQLVNRIDGRKFGSYFGGTLATAKLYGNSLNILVGAPTYSEDTFDEGRVYGYTFGKKKILEVFELDGTSTGDRGKCFGRKKTGSRFGAAITNLGQVIDNYDSVAIAAPYENNNEGVIYIYTGSRDKPVCSQRIEASTVHPTLKSFGISLSNARDIDSNNFKDFAIGSKGRVTIIKSNPVIKLTGNLLSSVTRLLEDTKNFDLTYCIKILPGKSKVKKATVNISLLLDKRAEQPVRNFEETVDDFCQTIKIELKANNYDFTNKFRIQMLYNIKESCSGCPVTSPGDDNHVELFIPYTTNCGEDNICETDFSIDAFFEGRINSIILGQQPSVKLFVNIKNKGEPGYLTRMNLTLPEDVAYLRCPSHCICKNITLDCSVANPLKDEKMLEFDLNIEKLSTVKHSFVVLTSIRSANIDKGETSKLASLSYTLNNNPQLIGYSSLEEEIIKEINNSTITFIHYFELKNLGPSPFQNYQLLLEIPSNLMTIQSELSKPDTMKCYETVSSDKEPTDNSVSTRTSKSDTIMFDCFNVECKKITCEGSWLLQKQSVTIHVTYNLNVSHLSTYFNDQTENKQYLEIETFGTANILDISLKNKTTTKIFKEPPPFEIPIWVYIVSILGALIIVSIIIFVLYKLNFFKRNRLDKELLEENTEMRETTPLKQEEIDLDS